MLAIRRTTVKALRWVLICKIAVTVFFWCVPLLTLPPSWLEALGIPDPGPVIFVRLLGAAYLALLVGYILAFLGLKPGKNIRDKDIENAVRVGIVSNGAASILLALLGITGAWNQWGGFAQAFMWTSAFAATMITLGLVWAYYLHDESQQRKEFP